MRKMNFQWIKYLGLIGLFYTAYVAPSPPPNKKRRNSLASVVSLKRKFEEKEDILLKKHILIQNFSPSEHFDNSIDFSIGGHQISLKLDLETSIISYNELPQGTIFFPLIIDLT